MAIPNGHSGWVFEASGLKKDYDDGQVQALRGVDFRIQQGEFVAIVGPSGSGKSVFIRVHPWLKLGGSGAQPRATARQPAGRQD